MANGKLFAMFLFNQAPKTLAQDKVWASGICRGG
jgi:hypothetical protein